jgi:hypothetical protein
MGNRPAASECILPVHSYTDEKIIGLLVRSGGVSGGVSICRFFLVERIP